MNNEGFPPAAATSLRRSSRLNLSNQRSSTVHHDDNRNQEDETNLEDETNQEGEVSFVEYTPEVLDGLVVTQKGRAIALWGDWNTLGNLRNITEDVHDHVLRQLQNGQVPPYFHTLCRKPKDRLFLPATTFDYKKVMRKERAIALWQSWYENGNLGDIDPVVYHEVLKNLEKEKVPVYFHVIYNQLKDRLFLPESSFNNGEIRKHRAILLWTYWYTKGRLGDISEDDYKAVLDELENGIPFIFRDHYNVLQDLFFFPKKNFDDATEIETNRAVALWEYWNISHKLDDFSPNTIDQVLVLLRAGKFPATFLDCYVNFKEKITIKIPMQIRLSANAVQCGKALCDVDGEIPSLQEDSHMKGFFCEDIKKARVNVVDNRLSKKWIFHEDYTKLVTDLVNEPAKMKGHDVEVTHLKSTFELDMRNGTNLITRSLSRGVVADCFRRLIFADSRAITGNPGIGKSWTLIYALQQVLVYENACVMFCFQKDGVALVCIRKNNCIYVWRNNDLLFKDKCMSNLVENRNVLVLLDPREAKKGGASYVGGARRLIFAASNNVIHFSANPDKITGDYQKILNPYSLNELKVALPYIIDETIPKEGRPTTNEMLCRTKEVGNLPRYLVSTEKFESRIKSRNSFIEYISNTHSAIGAVLSWNGMTNDNQTVPGTVFIVSVKETSMPQDLPMDVGYDGENVEKYKEIWISLMVPQMENKLLTKWRASILNYFGIISVVDRINMGFKVENLFWKDLKENREMVYRKMGGKGKLQKIVFGFSDNRDNVSLRKLKGFFETEANMVYRMVLNCSSIDFAGSGPRVYQVTVRSDHDVKATGTRDILLACGLLQKCCDGQLSITKRKIARLTFYWVVPNERKSEWVDKNPQEIKITGDLDDENVTTEGGRKRKRESISANRQILEKCFKEYVDHYVLIMTP